MIRQRFPLLAMLAALTSAAFGDQDAPLAPAPEPEALPGPVTLTAANNVNHAVSDVVDADCTVLATDSDPSTPLYLVPISLAAQAQCSQQERYPIMAPGDRHVTLGEWMDARGQVTVTCVEDGTRYEFDLEGLIPNGVYTVWQFNEGSGGALASSPTEIRNVFTAGPDGRALFDTLGPGGSMTFFGVAPGCTLPVPSKDAIELGVWMVVLYHTDHRDWGPFPGPEETGIAHLLFEGS